MAVTARSRREEVCPRCRLAIKRDALRCPHCGERLVSTGRFPLFVGIAGLFVLFFVAALMFKAIHESDLNPVEPAGDQQETAQPVQPDKTPPLNK